MWTMTQGMDQQTFKGFFTIVLISHIGDVRAWIRYALSVCLLCIIILPAEKSQFSTPLSESEASHSTVRFVLERIGSPAFTS